LFYDPTQDPYCVIPCLGLFAEQEYVQTIAITVFF